LKNASDERLVLAIARWRDDALAEAYRRHAASSFALAKRLLWDAGVAEEVVQEVFVKLWHEPERFDPARGTLRGWVATVAHRIASREARRMSRHPTESLTAELTALLLDPSPEPANVLERGLDQAQVRAILADPGSRIPEVSQWIIVMHCIEDRSVPQIAAELRLSEHCVEMRLNRALKKLRDLLRRRGFGQT